MFPANALTDTEIVELEDLGLDCSDYYPNGEFEDCSLNEVNAFFTEESHRKLYHSCVKDPSRSFIGNLTHQEYVQKFSSTPVLPRPKLAEGFCYV